MDSIAIVIGSKGVNATGLIRSLGMAGIDVTFMSNYSKIESKYTKNYVKLSSNIENWIGELIQYCKTLDENPIVFTTDDETAYLLDDNFEALNEFCIVPHANGNMRKKADKTVMAELAKASGLNVADFKKINLEDSDSLNIDFPVIVKPYAGYAGGKGDICICYTIDEYTNSINNLKEKGYTDVMVQRFLCASDQREIGLMGISMPNGNVIIPGTINKIRSYPTGRGSTSYAKFTAGVDCVDIEKLKSFILSTGYIGIFDIEMMIDNGQAWFIEINYRNGQYGFTPTKAGYNLPANWCKAMIGEIVDQPNNINEVYYINERDDYRHVKEGSISKKEWKKQFKNSQAFGMYCPGDQRPYIRQYVKIPDRVIIMVERILSLIKDLLVKEEWNVAFRPKEDALLYQNSGLEKPFEILPNSLRYWAADPFIISKNDTDYLFFEMFDRFKSKGLIGYREIKNGKVSKMKVAYEAPYHLSFPFIFEKDGVIYMMPEASEGNTLDILKAVDFPSKWEKCENIANDRRFVDSSLFERDNQVYLFTQELKDSYKFNQLDLYLLKENGLFAHSKNPIVDSSFNSRLAGRVFEYDGEIIRVSQDCSEDYGRQLNFNRVNEFSMDIYSEELFNSIKFEDINSNSNKQYFGVHTYNFNENYEVIDFKKKDTVEIGNIINIFYRIVSKIKR